jgi:hypothetical protein
MAFGYCDQIYSFVLYFMSICALETGFHGKADRLVQANLLDPNNPDIWGQLSLLRAVWDQWNAAFICLKEALKLKLSNLDILKKLA